MFRIMPDFLRFWKRKKVHSPYPQNGKSVSMTTHKTHQFILFIHTNIMSRNETYPCLNTPQPLVTRHLSNIHQTMTHLLTHYTDTRYTTTHHTTHIHIPEVTWTTHLCIQGCITRLYKQRRPACPQTGQCRRHQHRHCRHYHH